MLFAFIYFYLIGLCPLEQAARLIGLSLVAAPGRDRALLALACRLAPITDGSGC